MYVTISNIVAMFRFPNILLKIEMNRNFYITKNKSYTISIF